MIWRARADAWERHQRREIRTRLALLNRRYGLTGPPSCGPLYPGSMLFNQVAIDPVGHLPQCQTDVIPRFESLDAVYESLGVDCLSITEECALLVDCQTWWSELATLLEAAILRLLERSSSPCSIVLLSGSHTKKIKKIIGELDAKRVINIVVIRPLWHNVAWMLTLYRRCGYVLFVDTARSLDAAMTGVNCGLIAGPDYASQPVFPALYRALAEMPDCQVTLPGGVITVEWPGATGISTVENSSAELALCALANSAAAGTNCSVDNIKHSGSPVIIRSNVFWHQRLSYRLGNLRVSLRRKSRKLIEDPHAFFHDSGFVGFRLVASILRGSGSLSAKTHSNRQIL